jgi:inhibitor of cysteine peptidase
MKTGLILMGSLAVISLCFFGCSPVPKQVSVEASCDDFYEHQAISQEVQVAVDGSLTVTLCSNPTTGFEWESASISDQTVLQEVDHKFEASEATGDGSAVGAPGRDVWTFQALKKGTSTISMEYSRPWEGGEKAEWTFVLTAVVK